MKILISPYSKPLRNGERNPKNYSEWNMLAQLMLNEGWKLFQFTVPGEYSVHPDVVMVNPMKIVEIPEHILEFKYDTFISVDNFLPHLAAYYNFPGFVLWGKSDPLIYGHEIHTNILKSREYLRPDQFRIWEQTEYNPDVFMHPSLVIRKIKEIGKLTGVSDKILLVIVSK